MNRYTILEANVKNNKEDILPILQRNLENISTQCYEWKYENCPYGNAYCWLARHENSGSLVGSGALFPRKIFNEGEPTYAGIAGDFAVDKKHRAYGPAFHIQREIQSCLSNKGFKFIYGIPNDLSRAVFLKIGYKEIGKFNLFVKILKMEYLPEEYLGLSLRFKMLSRSIDFFMKIVSKEKRYKKTFNYSVEIPEFFDDRFDVFWKKATSQFKIIGERTSDFLNWRYKQSPAQEYKTFCILDDKKDIVGYIIYYLKNNMCYIVDMLFLRSEDILNSLLTEFVLYIRKNEIGYIVIRYLGNKLLEKKLKEFNFFMSKKDSTSVLIYSPNFSIESNLLDKKNWHFFLGDNDV